MSADHRGSGLGRRMLRHAVAYAYHTLEARRVWLDVKPTNERALALYRSEGFVEERTIPEALVEPDGTTSDLVVMTYRRAPDRYTLPASPQEESPQPRPTF